MVLCASVRRPGVTQLGRSSSDIVAETRIDSRTGGRGSRHDQRYQTKGSTYLFISLPQYCLLDGLSKIFSALWEEPTVTVLDDDYFPGRRLDDDCASPKHEVFAEEHAIVKWALSGIDRVL